MKTTGNHSDRKGSIIYFSHGGGPLPLLGDQGHAAMIKFMKDLPTRFPRPDAIIVVSAHWEQRIATVLAAPNPELYYDYYGFPDAAYDITYPAPGNPELARRLSGILEQDQIVSRLDRERGFDHGLFIPLNLMYPDADIPALQLSLVSGLDPATHINLGNALQDLMEENILVIGSGSSFHNMKAFIWDGTEPVDEANNAFQDWLIETCTGSMSREEREDRLVHWTQAPSARYCHPREEHLLPLHVCAGIAGENGAAVKIFDDCILGKRAIALYW